MKMLQAAHENLSSAVAHTVFATARALFAPGAVVHLGAGTGQGPLHGWRQWQVPASLVVDAQPQRMAWAAGWVAQGADRWVSEALVDGADGQAAKLHHASNPDESGLIAPKALQKLWPQLKALDATDTPTPTATRSLDALLCEPAHAALLDAANLWLVVDFFCSPDFWVGASATLAQARVVVLRQAKAAPKGIEPLHDTAERMAALGYALAATLESKHPEVVHAVYLRSLDHALSAARQQVQAQHRALAQESAALLASRDAQAKAQSALQTQLETQSLAKAALAQEKAALLAAHEAQSRAMDQAFAQCEHEAQAKELAQAQHESLVQENAALLASRDAQAKARSELQTQLEAQSQAKAALAQEKAELLAAHEAQSRALDEALAQRDQEAQAKERAQAQHGSLVQEKAALAQEIADLLAANEVESRAKDEALAQRGQEAQAKERAQSQCETLAQENAALLESRDAQAKARSELQTQLEEESRSKAALAQELAELLAANEVQLRAKHEALAQRDTLAQEGAALLASRDAEAKARADLKTQLEEESQAKAALAQEIAELLAANEVQSRAKDEALAQRDQEALAKEKAQAQCETLVQEKAALLASRDAEAKAHADLQAELEVEGQAKAALAQEITALADRYAGISADKEGQTARVQELLIQRDILVQEKSALAASRALEMQAKSKAQGERDVNATVIAERGGEIERLRTEIGVLRADLDSAQLRAHACESQNQSLYLRQDVLQDEMTKAEAQIELIKDLLLREPSL